MKKAIIIGASSGIGREVANLLIDEGWAVGVAARREDKLNELKAKARQLFNLTSATDGGKPSVVESACIDVTSDDAPAQLRALINRLGGMDLFFYASGIGKVNLQLQTDIELATVETNVVGFTRMIGAAYHYFAEAGGGHIAAISSIAGTMGLGPAPAYSASKAMQSTYLQAIEQLIYQQKLPIHITDIRPGFVNTALLTGQHYPMMLSPQKVARKIVQAINHKKHVCIIDWKYRLLTLLWRCIPKWLWRRLPLMRKRITLLISAMMVFMAVHGQSFPVISENATTGCFPLVEHGKAATICTDTEDYAVVGITAKMLSDDIERVTGLSPVLTSDVPKAPAVVAGTLGHNKLIDKLVSDGKINTEQLRGKWESFMITTAEHPKYHTPLLIIAGSDRRGTAFGLTTLCESIGVSPWYWWDDVPPAQKSTLYVEPGTFLQGEPSVQYRGIFINDERFGGWARWAEQHFEKETGKVGPKTYQKVFELLLRLKANYLWPAMHPGTQAFNADPDNARLADDYAIVMGSSHCEQMLRNNEGEWKAVNELAKSKGEKGLGDFNYITNRKTMHDYWEERVRTNGQYENTYTLGLRGIHDYPMEGANTTAERVALMQQAINDQRDMLRRNINKPLEEIPQVLCTYEEVLDAYHNGLQVPDDVTLLWSDDKHGYCRNLCNPGEQKRRGGAGIYYHLSYHGDPASWIWLSPLSPSFLSTELTKAYTYGARKIWVFNVGDIKPAEKELSFVMDLAWDINRWKPVDAHKYIAHWAEKTFGKPLADAIAELQARYYRLQAGGKDAHVWFVNYTDRQVADRIRECQTLETEVIALLERVPERQREAFFELVAYPIRGAALLNEYQLLARRSMVRATEGDSINALADADRVRIVFGELNAWTHHYNEEIQQGKWRDFLNWQPYHWFRSERIDPPICTPDILAMGQPSFKAQFLSVEKASSANGIAIESDSEADVPIWIEALSPIHNFSKAPEDNVFCHISTPYESFDASATPINNVWHASFVGPMWSRVGTLHLHKGENRFRISELKSGARIDRIFIGLWPPFEKDPRLRIPASDYQQKHDSRDGQIITVDGLGYTNGLVVQPFTTPSYELSNLAEAPHVDYEVDIEDKDHEIEIRTLPTLHIYAGRDARYAVQLGDAAPKIFSIHADDFSAEWRWNVLRGYASRSIPIPAGINGRQRLTIYLLDPGIVLQEVFFQ